MPDDLRPLPPWDGSWPPRPFDPAVAEQIRAALLAFETDHDVEATLRRIINAVQRRHPPAGPPSGGV